MRIFVVLSRDRSDFIFATLDETKAKTARDKQTEEEEMAGGRPSVYITETELQ